MVDREPAVIEFWFDFSSPYGYFASHRIEQIGAVAGREVVWRPFLIGAVFKETGSKPLVNIPLKGQYARHDWERLARWYDVPWCYPDPFPIATAAAARAFYWLDADDADRAKAFARACLLTYFGEGRNIADAAVLAGIAAGLGIAEDALLAALADEEVKSRLKDEVTLAMEKGVFGSPFVFVDDEPFWGADRLDMVAAWLASGGW
jgi:2-hydroxychromene-2-carboxylate isomerase